MNKLNLLILNQKTSSISTTNLKNGVYLLSLLKDEQIVGRSKLIKQSK